jgi:hypothetical protein
LQKKNFIFVFLPAADMTGRDEFVRAARSPFPNVLYSIFLAQEQGDQTRLWKIAQNVAQPFFVKKYT